ncbi:MAG TPA: amidohydrolase [Planctomycetes bacterium]|nr:amidohydrolase [Planctomycetota bacterium]
MKPVVILSLFLALGPNGIRGQDKPVVFTGARILPITGPPIENGVLIIQGGKIVQVGPLEDANIPSDATRHEVTGVIMPGLVDTHSHIGGPSGGDGSQPIQPECRVLDSINVHDPSIQKAQAGGLTTVNVMPGSGHLSSGQTVYIKLRDGESIEDLLIRDDKGRGLGGLKMANGTNSQRKPPFPGTRGKSAALVRQAYIDALAYGEKLRAAADDVSKRPKRDLRLEALLEVLKGRRVVHHHTHRADDIATVLRIAKEFGFRVVLHHVSEGWKVAKQIAEAKVPCSVILLDSPGGKLEAIGLRAETAGILERAGVDVSIHTDDPITDSRLFLRSGALAVRAGMTRKGALAALTIAGARALDLDKRIGSLEPGKDADFILLSGDPFSVKTKVMATWVEGRKVFDRSDPKDRLWAVGGWGASQGQVFELGCLTGEIK